MTLDQFTEPKLLIPALRGVTQVRVIAELVVRLQDDAITDAQDFYEAVMQQEKNSGPITARGIGFARGRSAVARKLSIAAGLSAAGLPWPKDAENKVHAVFVAAIPLDQEQNCTAVEAAIISLANDEMAYYALITCQRPEEMHSVLQSVHVILSASNQRPNRAVSSERNVPKKK